MQTYSSGDIPVDQTIVWKHYGFYFTAPYNTAAIVLRMTNNALGGYDNNLALDDITFRACGQLITAVVEGNTNSTINVCEGNSNIYTFTATVAAGYLSPVYQWHLSIDKGTTWNDIVNAATFTYQRQA